MHFAKSNGHANFGPRPFPDIRRQRVNDRRFLEKRRMSIENHNLALLRDYCMRLPETSEVNSWGHPNFRAGKRTFAAFEWTKGRPSVAIHLGTADSQAILMQHEAAFETPYGRGKWVSFWADAEIDEAFLQGLVERAYRSVALKRMIRALQARERQ